MDKKPEIKEENTLLSYVRKFFWYLKNIFLPDTLILEDGTIVTPSKPIMPYVFIVLVLLAWYSYNFTGFSFVTIYKQWNAVNGPVDYLKRFFPLDWSQNAKVFKLMVQTIQIALLGSFLGATLALPFAFFASSNMNKNRYSLNGIRIFLSLVRILPVLVYGVIYKLMVGPGVLPGVLAVMTFTFAIVAKMLFEKIETLDLGAYEAIQSTGASKIQAFRAAIMPQIAPIYYSLSLYAFEINIRYAAILGYVGAGGIGEKLKNALSSPVYSDQVMLIVLYIFIVVILIENLSRFLRRRLS